MASTTKKFIWNTIWSLLSQSANLLLGLAANIVLANMLSPFEFGQVGIIMFFVTIINVFTDSGLGGAIVRKKELLPTDYSTVFIFNIAISAFCFLSLLLFAGSIAQYYEDETLKPLIWASSIMICINSFNIVQNAKIYREMKLKLNLYINTFSVILSSIIGIFLAVHGYGAWALVIMNLALVTFKTGFLWLLLGGIGKLVFNIESFKSLYRYGVFTTLTSVVNTSFENIYQLMLGKYFSINQVGYFYQGKKIQGVSSQMLNSLSLGVVFSHLSKYQEDRHIFQQHYLRIFSFFSMLTGAIASLVFLLAKDTVQIVLGNIWLGSVIYIQILGIASFFQLHKIFCQNILKVYDRTEKIFTWELIASTIPIASIILGIILKNILIMLVGMIVSNLFAYLLNCYYSWKFLGLKASKELRLIYKIVVAAVVSIFFTQVVNTMNVNAIVSILLMTVLFLVFYITTLKLLRVLDSNLIFQLFKTSQAK